MAAPAYDWEQLYITLDASYRTLKEAFDIQKSEQDTMRTNFQALNRQLAAVTKERDTARDNLLEILHRCAGDYIQQHDPEDCGRKLPPREISSIVINVVWERQMGLKKTLDQLKELRIQDYERYQQDVALLNAQLEANARVLAQNKIYIETLVQSITAGGGVVPTVGAATISPTVQAPTPSAPAWIKPHQPAGAPSAPTTPDPAAQTQNSSHDLSDYLGEGVEDNTVPAPTPVVPAAPPTPPAKGIPRPAQNVPSGQQGTLSPKDIATLVKWEKSLTDPIYHLIIKDIGSTGEYATMTIAKRIPGYEVERGRSRSTVHTKFTDLKNHKVLQTEIYTPAGAQMTSGNKLTPLGRVFYERLTGRPAVPSMMDTMKQEHSSLDHGHVIMQIKNMFEQRGFTVKMEESEKLDRPNSQSRCDLLVKRRGPEIRVEYEEGNYSKDGYKAKILNGMKVSKGIYYITRNSDAKRAVKTAFDDLVVTEFGSLQQFEKQGYRFSVISFPEFADKTNWPETLD